MLIQSNGREVNKGLFEIIRAVLGIAVYPIFFFALAAAITPGRKRWQRIVGGVIASTLAVGFVYYAIVSNSR